jgi:predicted transcriptional regulator
MPRPKLRRPEIDELVHEEFNMVEIGELLDCTRENIRQYLSSRNLNHLYKSKQKHRRDQYKLIKECRKKRIKETVRTAVNGIDFYILTRSKEEDPAFHYAYAYSISHTKSGLSFNNAYQRATDIMQGPDCHELSRRWDIGLIATHIFLTNSNMRELYNQYAHKRTNN